MPAEIQPKEPNGTIPPGTNEAGDGSGGVATIENPPELGSTIKTVERSKTEPETL